jgi:DNA-binding NarL/FixJ family response regulator
MAPPVRVLLANEPCALRTHLEELFQHHSDVEVLRTGSDPTQLLMMIEDTQADVVVMTSPDSGAMPGRCRHLLHEYPQLVILALTANRTRRQVYRQIIAAEQLADTSEESIVMAIWQAKDHGPS